ncbi:MAG: PaaI family thioesterase [Chloroflexota bacterium]|nr:PaaI family thioesterase [Chloroflexota bacterium]
MDKQPSSRYCFLCGIDNPIGLKLAFFDDGEDRVVTEFTPREEHQGYPGTLHGGITCALLDETIGRTLVPYDIWAMTAEPNVRFRKQIPLGQPLQVVGELVRLRSRTMEGKGEIRLADGSVGATAEAKYILLPEEKMEAFKEELDYWEVVPEDINENS